MSEIPALVGALGLTAHPAGGWFRETWRSPTSVTLVDGRVRPTATLIHFVLGVGERSAWHRVTSAEIWLAHTGRVEVELGGSDDAPRIDVRHVLGVDVAAGDQPQVLVPAGVWQRTLPAASEVLVSCLVSPGFDFADFELAAPDPS